MRTLALIVAMVAGNYVVTALAANTDQAFCKFGTSPILDSQEVDLGDRSITYNRIETPILKPQPAPVTAPEAVERVPTAEELAEQRHWESLRYENLGGSATVFEGQGTEFRLWTPEGEVVALSSIDFNFLQSLWGFERDGTYYSVFFFAWQLSPEELAEAKEAEPEWLPVTGFPKDFAERSRFIVVSAPKGEAGKTGVRALEDLHAYFDENRKKLRTAYEEGEKARIAQEAWDKAHPPKPVSTTITYFPIRSSQLTAAEKAHLGEQEK